MTSPQYTLGALLAFTLSACGQVPETAVSSRWMMSESRDEITDQLFARTFAEGNKGAVGVKCDQPGPDSLYVQFSSVGYLGGRGAGVGMRKATYRFDARKPVSVTWGYEGNDAALVDRKNVWMFVDALRTARKVAIRATTYDGHEVTATIDVAGATQSVDKVIAVCQATRR